MALKNLRGGVGFMLQDDKKQTNLFPYCTHSLLPAGASRLRSGPDLSRPGAITPTGYARPGNIFFRHRRSQRFPFAHS